jgi:hypothetical protein
LSSLSDPITIIYKKLARYQIDKRFHGLNAREISKKIFSFVKPSSIESQSMTRRNVNVIFFGGMFFLFLIFGNRHLQEEVSEDGLHPSFLPFQPKQESPALTVNPASKDFTFDSTPDLVLPALNNNKLIEKAIESDKQGRYLFAKAREVNVVPHLDGKWIREGGQSNWEFTVKSPEAQSLNLGFKEFRLPAGGALTISDPTGATAPVTFTQRDQDNHGELWTPLFASDQLHLALTVPDQLASEVRLRLAKVNHGFRPPTPRKDQKAIGDSSSGSCNIDVICNAEDSSTFGPIVDLYRDQIRSVAAYTLGGIETCSGALINNTANNLKPYFLTADHCGISSSNAASVVVYWNFENSVCRTPGSSSSGGNGNGPITEFNSGSIFRAARQNSDFCLIELDDPVAATTEPYFAGWDRSGDNPVSAVGIHHPGVSEKRISFEMDPTETTNYYSNTPRSTGTHVRIRDWDFGTTEGGSSGSPLFDDRGRIIGQLHGGDAACGNNAADWYGRISRSWADGSTSASRLSDWLDPNNSGVTQIGGIGSNELVTVTGGSVEEGDDGSVSFMAQVQLSSAVNSEVVVTLSTSDGTATAGSGDFVDRDVRVTFSPGETLKSARIIVNGDLNPEENENFFLTLKNPRNALASSQRAEVVILNNDFIVPNINSELAVPASASSRFEYRISALNTPTGFAIANAPAGMVIDETTGVISWVPEGLGETTVEIRANNPAGTMSETLTINVLPNFLIQALDVDATTNLSNENPGWFLQTSFTRDGIDAAQAEEISDDEVADFLMELEGPDQISFWARVSSEEGFDFFTVEVDGSEKISLSGETGWRPLTVNIPAGSHTVTFRYAKDGSEESGMDTAWVDQISFASATGKPIVTSPRDVEVDTGSLLSYIIESIDPAATFTVTNLPNGLTFDGTDTVSGLLPSQGEYQFNVLSQAGGQSDLAVIALSVANPIGPAMEAGNLTWIREGGGKWFGQDVVSFDGVDAAQSGEIQNSQESSMSVRVTGPNRMTFWWKVSSEKGFDGLSFSIDRNQVSGVPQISGEQDWAFVSVRIPSGSHLVSWTYSKDSGESAGSDAGWVDDIRLSSGGRPMILANSLNQIVANRAVQIPLELVNEESFSFEDLPDWLAFNEEAKLLKGTVPSARTYSFSVTATNSLESVSLEIVLDAKATEEFLSQALDQEDLVVVSAAPGEWFLEGRVDATGNINARSGLIGNDEESRMTLFVQGPGTLGFRWMVSSEENFDYLNLSLNGTEIERISGELIWQDVSISLPAGLNQVTWNYLKDSSNSEGANVGRVDALSLGGYASFLSEQGLDHFSSDPEDDEDGDGRSLFAEYAFRSDHEVAEVTPILTLLPSVTHMGVEFPSRGNEQGVTYILESTPSLKRFSWTRVEDEAEVIESEDGPVHRFTNAAALNDKQALFFRVRAVSGEDQ